MLFLVRCPWHLLPLHGRRAHSPATNGSFVQSRPGTPYPAHRPDFSAHIRGGQCYAARMGRVHSLFAAWLLLVAALLPAQAHAQTFPERGRNAVVDAANVIPDKQEAALAARLTAWQRETGHQLVVATVPDLDGRPIADYAVGLLRHWRLGRAGTNDGILLVHAPNQRRVRIEVGYGLEASLPDVLANRILRETIVPALAQDPGAALTAGAERIIAEVAEPPAAAASATPVRLAAAPRPHPDDEGQSVASVLVWSVLPAGLIVLFIVCLYRRNRPARPDGPVRPLSKRAERRRRQRAAAAAAAGSVTWDGGAAFASSQFSTDSSSSSSSWSSSDSYSSSSDSGGFDSGGGDSGGGGSDSSY